MSLFKGLAARTPEEADRRRFGVWVGLALIVILPAWWFGGADILTAALRPVAAVILGLFGLQGGIVAGAEGAWIVSTGLPLADGSGTLDYTVAKEVLRRLMLGVPLFVAFMIAPPRAQRPVQGVLIGGAVLVVLFLLSLTAFLWGEIAPMLNPALAPAGGPPTRLTGEPLNPLLAQIAIVGRYVGMSVAPLIVSIVLWAVLNPRGREALLGQIEAEQ
ncbi:exosortase H-associated membrane protein [Brevundimonas variabilis]|uniref:Uncharacterized protein n=1 Tax=Brevundimonas variabilis TaxID=74312 RepID=A0A7W9CIA6_9CAUL|nr:exosortase H-associated membrane protein [Brevundimonas variabilis]MBB5746180.1 hypothetical protein [Brevundimonas variabilis]